MYLLNPENSFAVEGNISCGLLYDAALEKLMCGGKPDLVEETLCDSVPSFRPLSHPPPVIIPFCRIRNNFHMKKK